MDVFYYLYRLYNLSIKLPVFCKRLRIDSMLRHLIVFLSGLILPIYFIYTKKMKGNSLNSVQDLRNGRHIIVSLTSFPTRIDSVWLVVETLLRQKLKPHKVVLWLSKEQFVSIKSLPKPLLEQCSRGLEIRFVDGDIRSHKKYFYSFKEYSNDYVILVDDDILYPSNFIQELFTDMCEGCVNCSYGSLMQYKDGKLLPYKFWRNTNGMKTDSPNFFFGSGGGTLLIPSDLHKDSVNIELAIKLCPKADDIWLNAMCRLNRLQVHKVRSGLVFPIKIENNQALCTENIDQGLNDRQISSVQQFYISSIGVDPFKV